VPLLAHPGTDFALRKLPLHSPDGFEDVLQGVEVVEGALPLASSELEFRYLAEQRSHVERRFERLSYGHVYRLWL
jgi:hypothetical protein